MPEEVSSPNEEAGAGSAAAVDGTPPPVDGAAAAATEKKETEKWFIEMRGWIMVVAVQVASFTYQCGLNPPSGFSGSEDKGRRYKVFFYSNTTAFLTSLAIIILLMNRSFYRSVARVTVLEIIVVLDMMGLMAAYWAGSTRKHRGSAFALGLTALVLLVIYVVYAVQLVHKLHDAVQLVYNKLYHAVALVYKLIFAAAGRRRVSVAVPVRNQQLIHSTQAPPQLDVGQSKPAELRRRDSRLVARTPGTGKSTMLSP